MRLGLVAPALHPISQRPGPHTIQQAVLSRAPGDRGQTEQCIVLNYQAAAVPFGILRCESER
jgi:hypothetical protein